MSESTNPRKGRRVVGGSTVPVYPSGLDKYARNRMVGARVELAHARAYPFTTSIVPTRYSTDAAMAVMLSDADGECRHGALPGDRRKPRGCRCWR